MQAVNYNYKKDFREKLFCSGQCSIVPIFKNVYYSRVKAVYLSMAYSN